MMHGSSIYSGLLVAVLVTMLAPLGCGAEKRIKECVVRCEAEEKACAERRERDCPERIRKCKEACEH
jgi:hypothetical protein